MKNLTQTSQPNPAPSAFHFDPVLGRQREVQALPEGLRQVLAEVIARLEPANITVRCIERMPLALRVAISRPDIFEDEVGIVLQYFNKALVRGRAVRQGGDSQLIQDALRSLNA
ncbi:hypothetical protein [Hymenobacter ruricola]|uniref:Uncharacterized protein n=1 Tax=Hymenobacter ruricola TaxID=2791023 RepID=A0ABS0I333_9BACT|nr:hypothetical protein [Hymenobacter ruricola]MBF9221366.1 hypothetical protein [Hymenobacter ruricola]